MEYTHNGIVYNLDFEQDNERSGLRISYRIPWCPICNNYVEKFELQHDTPRPDYDTLVAHCHGAVHEKVISKQTGVSKVRQRTDLFFDDPRMASLRGRDTRHRIGNRYHEFEEIEGRLRSLKSNATVGEGGNIIWTKK